LADKSPNGFLKPGGSTGAGCSAFCVLPVVVFHIIRSFA
jgi:hypothetical protein